MGQGGGPCDYCVSPSPFDLDFGTLDLGTSALGLTKTWLKENSSVETKSESETYQFLTWINYKYTKFETKSEEINCIGYMHTLNEV